MDYGIVENINDPKKLGRVKVRVHGVHTKKILTKDLPWSIAMMPSNTPALNGIGHSTNFLVGSLVVGTFIDEHMQDFLVFGTLPTSTNSIKDNNVRVRGEVNPHADQERGAMEPPSGYAPEYPYNNVYETESGHVKEYDDTPGSERINERHKSGTLREVQPNGSIVEKIVRDRYTLVMHDDTLEVHGTVNIVVSENCNLAVAGYVTANVGGELVVESAGDITVSSEADITVNAKGTGNFIKLDTPLVHMTGNVVVDGTTTTSGSLVLDTHTHTSGVNDHSGTTSSTPITT
jgi:phage baseplate assembly protein gpV